MWKIKGRVNYKSLQVVRGLILNKTQSLIRWELITNKFDKARAYTKDRWVEKIER